MTTLEPTDSDGSSQNPTKSMCDPYVFNTVITRAQSLVVCVGNPFMLLKTEQQMTRKYGPRIKCWSTFLSFCLEKGSISIDPSLRLSEPDKERCLEKIRSCLTVGFIRSASDSKAEVKPVPPQLQTQVSCPPATGKTR